MDSSHAQMVSLIWNIADDVLRDVFVRGQYRDVILPMVVLRRLDALLEPTKKDVEEEYRYQKENGIEDEDALKEAARQSYYNISRWTLSRLKSEAPDDNKIMLDNFNEYLAGFSKNVADVISSFEFYAKAKKLAERDRLKGIIERITDPYINLTDRPQRDPDGLIIPALDNIGMGKIFEELLRRFNEENNEEAGEHFTPRDVISLLCSLTFEPLHDNLPKTVFLYDPACGSGGMLTESREYLHRDCGIAYDAIRLSGNEVNPETYAVCKSDLIIKGVDPKGIRLENTLSDNPALGERFGFMLTNPPYGKAWKEEKKKMYDDKGKELLDERFMLSLTNFDGTTSKVDSTPRVSDGQLLFMLELLDKMESLDYQPQGSRATSIHNGSSLFTGDAGQGESNIRRHVVEGDYVEAIIQLPNNIFYNTGITTYCWVLTNKKSDSRRGKIQLIDASRAYKPLRKNQGQRNCEITPECRAQILQVYRDMVEREADDSCPVASKIFSNDDFRYYSVSVLRPLRLRSQMNYENAEALLHDRQQPELSQWIYQTYGQEVFTGISAHAEEIRQYLRDNDQQITDKKLRDIIDPAKWRTRRDLSAAATALCEAMGTDAVWTNYNQFLADLTAKAKELDLKLSKTDVDKIGRAMSQTDPDAEPVVDKIVKRKCNDIDTLINTFGVDPDNLPYYGFYPAGKGQYATYEADKQLSDTEEVPVSDDILAYFKREVEPYVADAWIDLPATKIGCEISFNKYFYRPVPLRTLDENQAELAALTAESDALLRSLLNHD